MGRLASHATLSIGTFTRHFFNWNLNGYKIHFRKEVHR
jgi:hypothetical protein